MAAIDAVDSEAFCGERLSKDVVLRYYSKERVMGIQTRATWAPPDLLPIT